MERNPQQTRQADRTEPYTRIEPFTEKHDTSVECVKLVFTFAVKSFMSLFRFFFKPVTLTTLAFAMVALAYVAITDDVVEEGRDKKR